MLGPMFCGCGGLGILIKPVRTLVNKEIGSCPVCLVKVDWSVQLAKLPNRQVPQPRLVGGVVRGGNYLFFIPRRLIAYRDLYTFDFSMRGMTADSTWS